MLERVPNERIARRIRENVRAAGLDGGASVFAIAVELIFRKKGRCDLNDSRLAALTGLARQKVRLRRNQLVEAGIWAKPEDVDSHIDAVEFRATLMGDEWRPRTGSAVLDDPWPAGLPDPDELPEGVRALEWDLDLERLVLTLETGEDPLAGVEATREALRAAARADGSEVVPVAPEESTRPDALLAGRFGGDYRKAKREHAERICARANAWASREGRSENYEYVTTLHSGGFPAWVDWLRDWIEQGGKMRGGLELKRCFQELPSAPTRREMARLQSWGYVGR